MSNNAVNNSVNIVISRVLSIMNIPENSKLNKAQFDTFAKNFSKQGGSVRAIITLKYMVLGKSATGAQLTWPRD